MTPNISPSSIGWYTPTGTASAASASFTGDPTYPVFPNAAYISRFYRVSSELSGLTKLDKDLFNLCYLPWSYQQDPKPESESNRKREDSWISITIENPDYQSAKAPCRRQASINGNCYLQNTNGTFSGLQKYTDHFDEQQHCYCEKYPFFDAVLGCQKCFEMHGGIEGRHWFPESYVNALADAYCDADPPTKEFFDFVADWGETAAEASVPSTTAKDVLGTQTAASLYYTPVAAEVSSKKASSDAQRDGVRRRWKTVVTACTILAICICF